MTSVAHRRPGRPTGGRVLADRNQLIEAAERAVRTHGPDVTMEQIAGAATVTKPILYRTIGNKDAIVAALAERLVDRITTAVDTARRPSDDPRDAVRSTVTAYVSVVEADRSIFLFVTTGGGNDDTLGGSLHLADRSATPLAATLARGRAAAGRSPAVATTWAYAMIGMLQMVALWWLRDGTRTADEITDHLTELLWSGLGDP